MADVLIGQDGGRQLRELLLFSVVLKKEEECRVVRRRDLRRPETEEVHDHDMGG